ncbi:MAG: T9SS type A sorting domain-containing protein [Salinivirgaceae bacterium]
MKKTILLSLLTIFLKWAYCQEYETIIARGKSWVSYVRSSNEPFEYGYTYKLQFGDTTDIEGEKWIHVMMAFDSLYSIWEHKGFIIEADKVVRYMDKTEMLIDTIYDFNKGVDEFLDWCITIREIDSLEFAGKKRKAQIINDHHLIQEIHYEGVGSNAGLLGPFNFCKTGVYTYLVCYYENGDLQYLNPEFDSCFKRHFMGGKAKEFGDEIEFFPNPTQRILYINIPRGNFRPLIKIFNTQGNLLKSINTNTVLQVDISGFEKGIYLVTWLNKNNEKHILKLVIN